MGQVFYTWDQYVAYCDNDEMPKVCVFHFGVDGEAYEEVFREAISLGHVALFLDEAYEYAPTGSTWTGPPELKRICLQGRHLRNFKGDLCPCHLFASAQYARTLHPRIWAEARTVYVGRIEGEADKKWVKENFGEEKLRKVESLRQYRFCKVRDN
jgi:hypothetical protein